MSAVITCLECGSIIQSNHRHDYVVCSCGNVAVDGGNDYLKLNFKDSSKILIDGNPMEIDGVKELRVVIVNGFPGSGKDTLIDYICEKHSAEKVSSVDKVKEIATIMGWDAVKTPEARKFLATIKDAWTEYNNGPFHEMKRAIAKCRKDYIFLIVREPNEIRKLKDAFPNAKTLLVKRTQALGDQSNEADLNVETYPYSHTIFNDNSVEDLKIMADWFMENAWKK